MFGTTAAVSFFRGLAPAHPAALLHIQSDRANSVNGVEWVCYMFSYPSMRVSQGLVACYPQLSHSIDGNYSQRLCLYVQPPAESEPEPERRRHVCAPMSTRPDVIIFAWNTIHAHTGAGVCLLCRVFRLKLFEAVFFRSRSSSLLITKYYSTIL